MFDFTTHLYSLNPLQPLFIFLCIDMLSLKKKCPDNQKCIQSLSKLLISLKNVEWFFFNPCTVLVFSPLGTLGIAKPGRIYKGCLLLPCSSASVEYFLCSYVKWRCSFRRSVALQSIGRINMRFGKVGRNSPDISSGLYSPPERDLELEHCERKLNLDSPHLTEALNFEHSHSWET